MGLCRRLNCLTVLSSCAMIDRTFLYLAHPEVGFFGISLLVSTLAPIAVVVRRVLRSKVQSFSRFAWRIPIPWGQRQGKASLVIPGPTIQGTGKAVCGRKSPAPRDRAPTNRFCVSHVIPVRIFEQRNSASRGRRILFPLVLLL